MRPLTGGGFAERDRHGELNHIRPDYRDTSRECVFTGIGFSNLNDHSSERWRRSNRRLTEKHDDRVLGKAGLAQLLERQTTDTQIRIKFNINTTPDSQDQQRIMGWIVDLVSVARKQYGVKKHSDQTWIKSTWKKKWLEGEKSTGMWKGRSLPDTARYGEKEALK